MNNEICGFREAFKQQVPPSFFPLLATDRRDLP
jgi:hypothetical protein